MKKIMLIIAVVALSISASAQTKYWDSSRPEHRFTFGIRAGINTSKQYAINDQSDHENRLGFHAGLTADINIVRSFSVNTGVMYIQKGWKTDYSDNRGSVEKKDNAAYLEIPVLASYRVNLSDQVQFQLNIKNGTVNIAIVVLFLTEELISPAVQTAFLISGIDILRC